MNGEVVINFSLYWTAGAIIGLCTLMMILISRLHKIVIDLGVELSNFREEIMLLNFINGSVASKKNSRKMKKKPTLKRKKAGLKTKR